MTGANGFVGSHVVERLIEDGCKVFVHDFGDSLGPNRESVDVVISLAASADPRKALRDPENAYVNNVRVMVQTLEYARRVRARVLHVSTNEVYGGSGRRLRPKGPYAGGKACQEVICGSYEDVPTTIVVTQSLFGERQQADKLIPTAARSLMAGKPVTLQRNGSRWASRPFLHVRNLANALAFLARDEPIARVHVGAEESLSVREAVDTLADALGVEARVKVVEAGDRPGHELDVEPIGCDVKGWRPTYATAEALRDVALWYRDNDLANLHPSHSPSSYAANRAA